MRLSATIPRANVGARTFSPAECAAVCVDAWWVFTTTIVNKPFIAVVIVERAATNQVEPPMVCTVPQSLVYEFSRPTPTSNGLFDTN